MSDDPPVDDSARFLRFPQQTHDRWLRRCHREDVAPERAATLQIDRALRRPGSIMGEDTGTQNGRDWKAAALLLAAAWRKKAMTNERRAEP